MKQNPQLVFINRKGVRHLPSGVPPAPKIPPTGESQGLALNGICIIIAGSVCVKVPSCSRLMLLRPVWALTLNKQLERGRFIPCGTIMTLLFYEFPLLSPALSILSGLSVIRNPKGNFPLFYIASEICLTKYWTSSHNFIPLDSLVLDSKVALDEIFINKLNYVKCQPFLVGDSLLVGDSPFLLLLGFSGFSWVPFWGFSLHNSQEESCEALLQYQK